MHDLRIYTNNASQKIDRIRSDDEMNLEEFASLELLETLLSYVTSFYKQRARLCFYFSEKMLDDVSVFWSSIGGQLQYRMDNGPSYANYTAAATEQAEASLIAMAPWPRLFSSPQQADREQTVFEDLLEAQRKSLQSLQGWHTNFQKEVDHTEANLLEALRTYRDEASVISASVDLQKQRVDEVVTQGLAAIPDLSKSNAEAFKAWERAAAKELEKFTQEKRRELAKHLEGATKTLEKLRETVTAYENLSSQDAADILSSHYGREADGSRKSGFRMYIFGVILLVAGAAPLVLAVIFPHDGAGEGYWQSVIVRLSIGAIAVTAATVIIRLGSRFYRDATAAKRMELEMKTIGPFLANVTDRESVDAVHLEIVDRAFGRSYNVAEPAKDDEQVNVSAFSSILSAVSKVVSK